MSGAYYNEIDPKAAAWLRQLIANNLIPDGEVDERSIEDIRPSDLRGFRQCHFFAGIGGWADALRIARWPHHREVWTGSCPCQPFSAAGEGAAFADERHLWPAWFHLIEECRPATIFGEQVDAAIKRGWLDLVQSDMEGTGYAFAPIAIPAASVGAPHGRHRLWFVADAHGRHASTEGLQRSREQRQLAQDGRLAGGMAEPDDAERRSKMAGGDVANRDASGREQGNSESRKHRETGHLADTSAERCGEGSAHAGRIIAGDRSQRLATGSVSGSHVNGFWRDAEWIYCRDEKYRPVEPGTFPLAHGLPARVGRLRGYGNAIVPQVAAEVIAAYMSSF